MTDAELPVPSGDENLLTGGNALVKFQDDTMMGLALQRPRNLERVRDEVLAEVSAFPDYADRYFYSIPHRTKACQHPTGKLCPTCEMVEGASIHAALAIQRYWGNSFSSWAPMEETETHIWLMGTFVDYEKNTKFVRPVRAEKGYTPRATGNKPSTFKPHFGEKLANAINAAGSKAQRNAILAGVPDALKIMVFTKAKALVVGDEPSKLLEPKHVEAIRVEFAKFDVGMELLESKLGKEVGTWQMRDRATLLGLRTSLVDGMAASDLFGSTIKKTQSKPAPDTEASEKKREQGWERGQEFVKEIYAGERSVDPAKTEELPLSGPAASEPSAAAPAPAPAPAAAEKPTSEQDTGNHGTGVPPEDDPFTAELFGDDK